MKTALVTGASGGIGKATVKALIKDGYFVLGQYNLGEKAISQLKAELEKEGLLDYFFAYKADFSKKDGAIELYNAISKSFKRIDGLVINAGVDLYKMVIDTTEEEWDNLFNVNLKAGFTLCKNFLPAMTEKGEGRIVFVSSVWGQKGASMEAVYSATKWGMIGFAKSLAEELASTGVTVNCVCPGVVDTQMNSRFSKEEMEEIISQIPLGRMITPQEVAKEIAYFLSDDAKGVTGQEITIDGGWTL